MARITSYPKPAVLRRVGNEWSALKGDYKTHIDFKELRMKAAKKPLLIGSTWAA
jgi:hypothetical protein